MSDDLTDRLRNHAAFERDNPRRAMAGVSAHDWDEAADRITELETIVNHPIIQASIKLNWHLWGDTDG